MFEDEIKKLLGDLLYQLAAAQHQIADLQAQLAQLKKQDS